MRRAGFFCVLLIALLAACSGQSTGNTSAPSGDAAIGNLNTQTTPGATPGTTPGATTHASSTPTAKSQTPWSPNTLIPPGGQLPDDATCAARVQKSSWEPRPDNKQANNTNVYASGAWRPHTLSSDPSQNYAALRVTGNFSGTTDEILQWVACKWGFPVDTVRAQAVVESYWHQNVNGDCNGQKTQPETNGCESVGILQVRGANIPPTHPGTWPYAYQSTAWNADYTLGIRRACFEGKMTWLNDPGKAGGYSAGDMWGCVGFWYSGDWHVSAAETYITKVKQALQNRTWTKSSF
jgi:autotransporter family porin